MSPDISSPKSAVYRGDDRDMLESLKGLSIKNFHDCNDGTGPHTPSSTSSSLLTPPALRSSQVFLATADRPFHGHTWYPATPSAPRMKDLDSFTDGTGHGSFDFPLSTGDDALMYPLIFHPTEEVDNDEPLDEIASPTTTATYSNSLALNLLPHTDDPEDFVRAWIEGVSANIPNNDPEPTPRKRRRSLTASSEAEARRVRAWSPTVEPSHAPQLGPREVRCPASLNEPEVPD